MAANITNSQACALGLAKVTDLASPANQALSAAGSNATDVALPADSSDGFDVVNVDAEQVASS